MKATFEKQNINSEMVNENQYIQMFANMGFEAKKVDISFTNGCSAYVSLNVKVLNENKMWAETFVYEGKATIQVRVSDHASNLEKICCGVSGNKMSMVAFKKLIENNVIENA
jgi:hypothetical protein